MADAADAPLTTSAVLMSASRHIGKKCGAENRAFLECKKADENPAACLKHGKEVTSCVISLSVPPLPAAFRFSPRLAPSFVSPSRASPGPWAWSRIRGLVLTTLVGSAACRFRRDPAIGLVAGRTN